MTDFEVKTSLISSLLSELLKNLHDAQLLGFVLIFSQVLNNCLLGDKVRLQELYFKQENLKV
jgi:hypothetical protein